ncbi:MAG TPA: hypothetical protein VGJ53_15150 [Micromonosporaceae bacterium]
MTALTLACCLAIGAAAALTRGLTSCAPPAEPAAGRALSPDEAGRLAAMRLHNFRDGVVGVRATIGHPGQQSQVAGWVDWRRPLAYLTVIGPSDSLVQAIPGVIAVRPGQPPSGASPASTGASPAFGGATPAQDPPTRPPADGWRLRPLVLGGEATPALDTFVGLLFTIAATRLDAADALAHSDARWLRRDVADGVPVDVLLGPAVPPSSRPEATPAPAGTPSTSADTSLAAMGGAVVYWLDTDARLRRFEALLGEDVPVRADLERERLAAPTAIDLLGGAPIAPRSVTADEARTLSRLRQRDWAAGGGEMSMTVPTASGTLQLGAGWLDWRANVAYLAVDDAARRTLLRADRDGVATRSAPPGPYQPGDQPPLPLPRDEDWAFVPWDKRVGYDFDTLLGEALGLSGWSRDYASELRNTAVWLRQDAVAGTPVAVYEMPQAVEKGIPRGGARLRYWVAEDGVLRRLELRTRLGAWGRLDLDPGQVPTLRRVPLA